ncbi:DUF2971 domain-containing protein [Thalassospira sp. ER-Se-21-Dark]|uniref:DUF2971 domain-containing protein n=1 Tax=Thalassospira sp. ER-Se-21-Dark TaxID=2585190 RepID=UPI001B30461F|nr:DUF2971 domain-containing protein [Thalassospira sp. ER-Se-21-Dark]MBP3127500.1 DUF2971 domain-containing protein [Thalassospira sp. ER-Se-21-Dark]
MEISEEQIWEKHESLFHYTDQAGLLGILNTNDFWASSYKFLNDSQEVLHFREVLLGVLFPHFLKAVSEAVKLGRVSQSELDLFSGVRGLAESQAIEFIDSLYRSTFESDGDNVEAVHPFFVSFCSHNGEYEQANGLLSQWRGYGAGGGYAIEFDTHKLAQYIEVGLSKYDWAVAYMGDVVYGSEYSELGSVRPKIDKIVEAANRLFLGQEPHFKPDTYDAFVNPATRLKHWGFHEEHEVRIVAAPILRGSIFDDGSTSDERCKKILCRNSRRGILPYIQLVEDSAQALPIKKIIVGPSSDQDRSFAAVRFALRGRDIKVVKSSTPFVG